MRLSKLIRIVLLIGSLNALVLAITTRSLPAIATQEMSTIYLPVITNLDSNLVHYWSFNEGSGTIVHDSQQSAHGEISGGADGWTTGPNNSAAFAFDGDHHVRLNLSNLPPPWTASVWVKRTDTARGMAFLGSQTHFIKLEQWRDTGKVGLTEWFVANQTFDYATPLNTWVHLTFVSTGVETQLYVNGLFVEQTNFNMPLPLEVIGNNGTEWNEAIIATIDEFRVWDVAYSSTDVLKLFNATNP